MPEPGPSGLSAAALTQLRAVHARLEHELAALKVHLSVARLAAHTLSLRSDELETAAGAYDRAQRDADSLARSLDSASSIVVPRKDAQP